MCHKAEINFKFLNRDLGDISCWSKFLTKNIQFLKWNSTKISNAEISYIRNIGNPVSFIPNIRTKNLMDTKDIWICANCTKKRKIVCAHMWLTYAKLSPKLWDFICPVMLKMTLYVPDVCTYCRMSHVI